VDDGAKLLDDSLQIAQTAAAQGTKGIFATPHVNRDTYFFKDPETIDKKVSELKKLLEDHQIDIDLYSGAELHISHNIVDDIKASRDYLVLNRSQYLLIEFPSDHIFSGVENILFELMCEGIVPVIAHPERNNIFVSYPERLFDLIHLGALAQANSGSFVGLYGDKAAEAVVLFMEHRLIHFLASDSHSLRSLETFNFNTFALIAEGFGAAAVKALVHDNPLAIVKNEKVPYVPDPIDPRKSERSLKIKLPRFLRNNS
jgi:protein-tyrosine phosphatase